MILKEIDIKQCVDKYQKYGYEAEKQMAFYLKRAFQNSADIFVINDLRLEMNDDVAQIDHLIIHRYGFIILESKSVTSKISVNEYEEWTRHFTSFTKGMPSPINQAKRQADFLKDFLMVRTEYLLRKKIVFQASITDFKFDVLVAVSDSGIINRARNTKLPEVCKADQITEAIGSLIASYAAVNKKLLSIEVNYQFADSSIDKVKKYLLKSHRPLPVKSIATKPTTIKTEKLEIQLDKQPSETQTATANTCSKCQSESLEINYGRYGYYFKCLDCTGTTSIRLKCRDSSCRPRIKKRQDHFYKVCPSCDTSALYFINRPVEKAVCS